MAQKPSIPKGTRDFSPAEMMRRTYIFDSIKEVFRTFGYAPLETPAMENLSSLMGKYGEEGERHSESELRKHAENADLLYVVQSEDDAKSDACNHKVLADEVHPVLTSLS